MRRKWPAHCQRMKGSRFLRERLARKIENEAMEKVYYTACVSVVVNFFPIGECDEFRCGNVWGQ